MHYIYGSVWAIPTLYRVYRLYDNINFHRNSVRSSYLKIRCRDASHLLLSLLLLFVYFLALPSFLTSSIYLVAFYTCIIIVGHGHGITRLHMYKQLYFVGQHENQLIMYSLDLVIFMVHEGSIGQCSYVAYEYGT